MKENSKIHFIAIGGSAMHNLAIALHKKGYVVSGSDDEIVEPSKSRLEKHGLLPNESGWFPEKINANLDFIILGMHARENNPELKRAIDLGLKVYSYPEFLYEQSKDKIRVVIGGSHGKTTITSMILHVLNFCDKEFDYMVGAQLAGFDTMVKLSNSSPIIILEGDEYLSSPIHKKPKFHFYKANIALLSGIAWDHINVFPSFENYLQQFDEFIDTIEPEGTLIYCKNDLELNNLVGKKLNRISQSDFEISRTDKKIKSLPYEAMSSTIKDGITYLATDYGEVPLQIFGEHNLQNIAGARLVCNQLGINDAQFWEAIKTFKGASRRLELVAQTKEAIVFKDFAHSPSKLKATTMAVKSQYPQRALIACMELHTFSSLNKKFMIEYKGAMDTADIAIVYYNPHTIKHKKLEDISPEIVKQAFDNPNLKVFTDSQEMIQFLKSISWINKNLLLMSSGNFDGMNVDEFSQQLLKENIDIS